MRFREVREVRLHPDDESYENYIKRIEEMDRRHRENAEELEALDTIELDSEDEFDIENIRNMDTTAFSYEPSGLGEEGLEHDDAFDLAQNNVISSEELGDMLSEAFFDGLEDDEEIDDLALNDEIGLDLD